MLLKLLLSYWPALLAGAGVTISMAWVAILAGVLLGVPLGWFAYEKRYAGARYVLRAGKWFLSSVPPLMMILWFYYPLQALLHVDMGPFWSASLALAIVNVLVVGQMVQGARCTLPMELRDMLRLSGGNRWHLMLKVEGPHILKTALPAYINSQIALLHATLLASFIGVEDLLKVASHINSQTYRPVEVYTLLALIFGLLCLPLTLWAARFARATQD